MENQVIEVLNTAHGKKVIQYWKSIADLDSGYDGRWNKKDGDSHRYYGFINGQFRGYTIKEVEKSNAKIIELPMVNASSQLPEEPQKVDQLPVEKITEKDLIGELEGFSIDLVEEMLAEQVRQGDPRDVEVFQKAKDGGFCWEESLKGKDYWSNAIYGATDKKKMAEPEKTDNDWVERMTELTKLHAEIEKLKAENESLRKELDKAIENKDQWYEAYKDVQNRFDKFKNAVKSVVLFID